MIIMFIKRLTNDTMPLSYISISIAKCTTKMRSGRKRNNMEKCDFSIIAIRNSGKKRNQKVLLSSQELFQIKTIKNGGSSVRKDRIFFNVLFSIADFIKVGDKNQGLSLNMQ